MNRLHQATSPYLRQHADNPVDWWQWENEAFDEAARRDIPVLLSVGYAACHWCHVMAHESFEDDNIAQLMNNNFINIKVDREERPDIDALYMEAVTSMTGQGGWPMTVFLSPDRRPFLAGTYFPPQARHGLPAFSEVLTAVSEAWKHRRGDISEHADQLTAAITLRMSRAVKPDPITATDVDAAIKILLDQHDSEWGGFGTAPKFPQTSALELLVLDGQQRCLEAAVTTADAMASGGIYDHVGGGFARYSVDNFWMVPHFEKMLYDQAGLAQFYVHLYQKTGQNRFRQVATETIEYVLRTLADPHGGFYSAQDADSDGEEGKYYLWRHEEMQDAIKDPELCAAAKAWYGTTKAGNFEGSNILHRPRRGDLERPEGIEQARQLLLSARGLRNPPSTDDKVVTEWNAMFIATLAHAGSALERPDWIDTAVTGMEFLIQELRADDGRWWRSWRDGQRSDVLAFANDYAWVINAAVELAQATGQRRWEDLALEVTKEMLALFDDGQGGLTMSGSDAEQMVVPVSDIFDGATASAHSVAAMAWLKVAALSSDESLRDRAVDLICSLGADAKAQPGAFANLYRAAKLQLAGLDCLVIAGDHPELGSMASKERNDSLITAWGARPDANNGASALWEGRQDGAYLCQGHQCSAPARSPEELRQLLEARA